MPRHALTTLAIAALLATGPLTASASADPVDAIGDLVSSGPLAAAVTPPAAADATRIVYRTTGPSDLPALSSGAIYFPAGTPPQGGWPVIAWAHGTTGLTDACAYSVGGPVEVDRDWAYLDHWLGQGYAVVATDYAGPGVGGLLPYLNGKVEAHNVVDAVKAATRAYSGTLSRNWVVVGQSQGGGAAIITARYATEFGGPELNYLGAVGTGVPAHIEDVLMPLGPHTPPVRLPAHTTEYVLYILSGLRTSYPDLDIDSYLTDEGRRWVDHAEQVCALPLADELTATPVILGDLFAKPLAALPDAHDLLTDYLGIPVSGYDRPLFIGQGMTDTDVLVPGTLATVTAMQANHQPLTFHAYPTDHDATVNASLPDSTPFLQQLFATAH
ncbi:lipase family protein [Nocardia sp. CA-151230]|uniref:lipase family protein n=1 Tax=Nocardia sp. CA-151230 TaxID=3239982 RepID=UPI003D8D610F